MLNPIVFTERVVSDFLSYQLTAYPFSDARLYAQLRRLLNLDQTRRSPLLAGPFVTLSRAFAQGISVKDAVKEGLLHPHIANLATHPHLYGHQEEAIRAILSGHPTLVSTGTGSGKTECFLFPAISRALRLRDAKAAPGITTVIVYPMNALADDQMDRLRELLAGSGVTFAIYTGATPSKKADAPGIRLLPGSSRADYRAELARQRDEAGEAKRPRVVHPAEEVVSREELRAPGGQPRILLTNVKQLELLLTRQKDIELFDGATLDYLVFDEAHTFRGAFGAETACLIRRLRAFCGRTPEQTVCIGTSATLVDPNNEESSVAGREFAARFFGVDETKVRLVGERYEAEDVWRPIRKLPAPVLDPAGQLQTVLEVVELDQPGQRLHDIYAGMTGERLDANRWSEQLFASLSGNELLWQIVQQLATARNLAELARKVSEAVGRAVTEEEILLWLALGAAARKEERPLVRPVIHTFVRGLGGAVVAFPTGVTEPQLSLAADHVPPDPQLGNKPPRDLPVLTCTTCGQHYFEHHAQDFDCGNGQLQGGNLLATGGRWWEAKDVANGGRRLLLVDRLISDDDDDNPSQPRRSVPVYFCRACGSLHEATANTCQGCGRPGPLVELFACELESNNRGGRLRSCICCRAIGRSVGGRDREPARPVRAVTVSDVDVLARSMIHQAERKRLLVFADNRQDAAFQSGWMQDHARRFRLRGLMWGKIKLGPIALGDLVFHLDQLLDGDESLSRALLPEVWRWVPKTAAGNEHQDKRRFYLRCQVLREFTTSSRQRLGLESWGRVRVEYHGLSKNDAFYQKWCPALGLSKEQLCEGVAALLDYERRGAQLVWDASGKIFSRFFGDGAWEIQRGFLPEIPGGPKGLVLQRDSSHDDSRIRQWFSSRDTVAVQAISRWGVQPTDRRNFMDELWKFLSRTARVLIPVDLKGQRGGNLPQCAGAHQIDGDRLLLVPANGQAWRCQTCRRVHLHRTPHDACIRFRCQGQLVPLVEDADSYDLRVLDGAFTMLRPREHSAQVPQAERTEAELMFKGKGERLNCLVCTPTLELGVDIGQLDSILMRNIPPLASNYFQRAGRAGRRHRMAVNLAYARPASHDRAYFAEPLKLLNGVVTAPRFNLHNGLLIRKHVHASLVTALFRLLRNRNGALSEPALDELQKTLDITVPKQVREWFFASDGSVLNLPVGLEKFTATLQKHRAVLLADTRAIFTSFWPIADADLVSDVRLGQYLDEAPRELESVMARIWGRLQWHRRQLQELARIRGVKGSLDDEEQAFERRCNEFINRLKGESSRQRRQTEGFDETNTYAVLAAEGFLPGYGLDRGSVKATALANRAYGGMDFDLPRPSSLAVREYVPGNLIYANGEKYVPRIFHLLAEQAERFVVDITHEAIAPEAGGGALGSASIPAVPICDVDAPHISRISDEEDFRFQMPVCVWGYELGRHDGGLTFRAGEQVTQLLRATYLRLVNVGPRDRVAQAELGYPACLVSGQTRSPYASAAELQNFKDTQLERHNRPIEEHLAFFTDVVADALRFPDMGSRIEAYSLGEALRIAAAGILDMEVDDLQLLLIGHTGDEKVDLLIYDPMPGGSGLLQQLLSDWPAVISEAESVCQHCEAQCASSCIDCLQTFRNAFYHAHLDRHVALAVLAKCAGGLVEENPIPPNQLAPASSGPKELPVNEAEDLLLFYMLAAGLTQPECQKHIPRPRPYMSTTPDFFYADDHTTGICIYLDGLSAHIHGNPTTKQRDTEIRSQLEAEGYEVFSITYTKLFDVDAVRMFLTRVAKSLVGRDAAAKVSAQTAWFKDARAVALRKKATAPAKP
jgi:ATP-dependent helicase YprA (DUF1998 family)